MNLKKAKHLRKAAGYNVTRDGTQYEPQTFREKLFEHMTSKGVALDKCRITLAMHLKSGSPKQTYKMLKRLERRVGLDKIYEGLMKEHMSEVTDG